MCKNNGRFKRVKTVVLFGLTCQLLWVLLWQIYCTRVKQEIDITKSRGATRYQWSKKAEIYLHLVGQLADFPHANHFDVLLSTPLALWVLGLVNNPMMPDFVGELSQQKISGSWSLQRTKLDHVTLSVLKNRKKKWRKKALTLRRSATILWFYENPKHRQQKTKSCQQWEENQEKNLMVLLIIRTWVLYSVVEKPMVSSPFYTSDWRRHDYLLQKIDGPVQDFMSLSVYFFFCLSATSTTDRHNYILI